MSRGEFIDDFVSGFSTWYARCSRRGGLGARYAPAGRTAMGMVVAFLAVGCAANADDHPESDALDASTTPFVPGALEAGIHVDADVRRLTPDTALPQRLSELGIFPEAGWLAPARGVEVHEPMHELDAGDLVKVRHRILPQGATSGTRAAAIPGLPVDPSGTIFVKTFAYVAEDGRLIPLESRVFRVFDQKAPEYATYRWNALSWEAEVAPRELRTQVAYGDGAHTIPSHQDCLTCHQRGTQSPVLGRLSYPQEPADGLPVDVADYVRGNCTFCHRGHVPTGGLGLDGPSLAEALISVRTRGGHVGSPNLIEPGSADRSAMWVSMNGGRDLLPRMPPLPFIQTNAAIVAALGAYIDALPPVAP